MNVELLRGKTLETGIVLDQSPIAQHETSAIFLGESRIRHVGGRAEAMAVKVFNTDADHMDEGLARREGHIHLAFGGHPNIITPYEYSVKELQDPVSGEFLQFPVLAMEYASEHSVKERLHAGEISLSDAVRIASETAYALQSVHDGGYVHRDVKPQNIGLVPAIDGGARYHARLLDFGIAMRINPLGDETDEERTITQQTRQGFGGTPDFIAPEQLRLKAEYVSDEWSLAEVMKRMMAGKQHDALEAVVKKGHQEDPEDRYPYIAEFGEELVRAHSGKDPKSTYIDLGSVQSRLTAEVQAVKGQAAVNTARSAELDARDVEQAEIAQRLASEAAAQTTKEEQFARQYQLRDEQLNALTDLRAAQRVVEAAQNNREEELRTQAGELDDRRRALSSGESQLKGEREDFEGEIQQITTTLGKRADKLTKEEEKSRRALDKREQKVREGEESLQTAEAASLERIGEEESAARERIHGEREVLQEEIAGERHELEEQARVIGNRGEAVTAREQRVGDREVAAAQRDADLDEREAGIAADAQRKNAELDIRIAAFQGRVDAVLDLERRVEGDAANNAERTRELDVREVSVGEMEEDEAYLKVLELRRRSISKDTLIGKKLGGINLEQIISKKEGISKIYLAHAEAFGQPIVLKMFLANDSRYDSPTKIRYDRDPHTHANAGPWGVSPNKGGEGYFIVSPFTNYGSIRDYMDIRDGLSIIQTINFLGQAADGVESWGDIGHGNIKPGNLLLHKDSPEISLKVIVTDQGQQPTRGYYPRPYLFQPEKYIAYMAPEQINPKYEGSDIDARLESRRIDVYSLGAVAYEMFTGRVPILTGGYENYIQALWNAQPPTFSEILKDRMTSDLAALEVPVMKALSKKPEDRYANTTEFFQALKAAYEVGLTFERRSKAMEYFNEAAHVGKSPEERMTLYDKALSLDPACFYAVHNKGQSLENSGKYDESLSLYDQAIETEALEGPMLGWVLFARADVLSKLDRDTDAVAAYDQVIALDPGNISVYTNKANALEKLGRDEEAEEMHAKARELEAKEKKS